MTERERDLLCKIARIVSEGRGQEGSKILDEIDSVERDYIYRNMDEE